MRFRFSVLPFFKTSTSVIFYIDEENFSLMKEKRPCEGDDLSVISQHDSLEKAKEAFFELVKKITNQCYDFTSRASGKIELNQKISFEDYEEKIDFERAIEQGKNAEAWDFYISPILVKYIEKF